MDLKLVTETLNEMKQQCDEEKHAIIMARKDLTAITTLLDKMKQLPIISGIISGGELVPVSLSSPPSSSSFPPEQIQQDGQLVKLLKEIRNYNIAVKGFTIELTIHDQQLEEKRERCLRKENTINLHNKIVNEVKILTNQLENENNVLKKKDSEMTLLANNIKLSTLDIDFIEKRLDARSKLFKDYMETNKTTDKAIRQITAELGKHIEEIKVLSNEFINHNSSPDHVHDLLKKIKEKEDIMDCAAVLLKKYDKENTNLQQLFDAIRLNNMTNIFELLIKNFQNMVHDMAACKEEIKYVRAGISDIEKLVKTKSEHLEILLEDVAVNMKSKPVFYPINGNNKDLLDHLTNLYNEKKENQKLKTLVKNIKDKGAEVIRLCRGIINYQENENQKLSLEISAKSDVVLKLQEKYCALHQEVNANTEIMILQSKLVNLMEENEHLMVTNAYLKSQDAKLSNDVKTAGEKINMLETENAELQESNMELTNSNMNLLEKLQKMETYVAFVHNNLREMQYDDDDDDIFISQDSEDMYNII